MTTQRPLSEKLVLVQQQPSPGFTTHGLRAFSGASMDPFLNLDDFHMSRPTFPPHPHAGFSAVTYMFPDSSGAFVNRDSLGDRSLIEPGALHWTQAARGMMHEEVPERPGTDCHGLQMFVNLAAVHKQADPRAFHVRAKDIPEVTPHPGVTVRVLAGALGKTASPLVHLLTAVTLWDVHVAPGVRAEIPLGSEPHAFAMVVGGHGTLGSELTHVGAHEAVALGSTGDALTVAAGRDGLNFLLAAGHPLGEPVVAGGPFVMNDHAGLEDAMRRFRRGGMGHLEPSF